MKHRVQGDPARRAVGYLRLSPRGEGSLEEERYGIDAQEAAIASWARLRGVRVLASYRDDVGGAVAPNERPGLLAALGALRERGAGVLIVARRDRLARDVVAAQLVTRLVERAGARLVSADGLSDQDGPQGDLLRGIVDVFSQYERALIQDRTRRALRAKMARGEMVGSRPPYGTRAVGGRLVPDAREKWVIDQVLALRRAGVSFRLISEALAKVGVLSREGTPLAKTALRNIILRHAPEGSPERALLREADRS